MAKLESTFTPKEVLDRVRDTALFVKSVLHKPFPDLEAVNPSFGVLSKYCGLLAAILKEEKEESGSCHAALAEKLATILAEVAEAIVDRNDRNIIDCMSELDEFLAQSRDTPSIKAV